MKRILLTGSGGFIGKHLKQYLGKYYRLFTPRSYELNLLNAINTAKYIVNNNIEFIIHGASYGVKITSEATFENVTEPNIKMFDNLVTSNLPMITIGSGAEYDKSRELIDVKEEEFGNFIPKDPYGYSKYVISKRIENVDNVLNLRVFGIYGSEELESRVTSYIIRSNINHKPIELNQNVKFHFIWIDDFCEIVKYFIEHRINEKFLNATPDESIEILKLAEIVNNFSDFKSDIFIKNPSMNLQYTGNNTKLRSIIKNINFTSYEDGLKRLLQWYKKF